MAPTDDLRVTQSPYVRSRGLDARARPGGGAPGVSAGDVTFLVWEREVLAAGLSQVTVLSNNVGGQRRHAAG